MAPLQLKQGTIVIVSMTPERGIAKARTAMVYTPDSVLSTSNQVDIVAISGSCYADDPDQIPLPHRPDGNIMTRLTRECSVALRFTATVDKENVKPTAGYVPKSVLVEVLAGLKRLGKI